MRNTEKYPITTQEIVSCLLELSDELANQRPLRIGDMRPLLLQKAAEIVAQAGPPPPVFLSESSCSSTAEQPADNR